MRRPVTAIAIRQPEFDCYKDPTGAPLRILSPITRLNLFVGSNNSGKSRLMRALATDAQPRVLLDGFNLQGVNMKLQESLNEVASALERGGYSAVGSVELQAVKQMQSLPNSLLLAGDAYRQYREQFKKWLSVSDQSNSSTSRQGGKRLPLGNVAQLVRDAAETALAVLTDIPVFGKDDMPRRVYIPILRGCREVAGSGQDVYQVRTQSDYWPSGPSGTPEPPLVFTGLPIHKQLTDYLLGTNNQRKRIAEYQRFLSREFFQNQLVTLIPRIADSSVYVKIGTEHEQPIHHLGDGIQSAIILSFLPFMTEEPSWFFIEEPELHLHPGLQRKLLRYFGSATHQHSFFLTTHSNHLLDLTIDEASATIFTFRKTVDGPGDEVVPTFTIENVDNGHHSSLELLGVRNSSVFLVNATIWVEGITDRWYLRTMLQSYLQHRKQEKLPTPLLEEDIHYSFVEYGGANITHWSFLDAEVAPIEVRSLCARAMLIIDGDGDRKKDRKQKLEERLGQRLIVLPAREIENTLNYDVICKVVESYEPKTIHACIKRDLDHDRYKNLYLGKFINNVVLDGESTRVGGYAESSGTIKDKIAFCQRARPHIRYDCLPAETKAVVQRIYGFVCDQNA